MMLSSATKLALRGGKTTTRAARHAFTEVIVGVAFKGDGDAVGMKAPKLWPAEPLSLIWMVSGGRPLSPSFREISADNIVHAVRLRLRIGSSISTFSPRCRAGCASSMSLLSRALSRA